jgi:hypothetical protein
MKRSDRETMLAFRVPRELHERLKTAAEKNNRGITAEVRERLEASLAPRAVNSDPKTQELLDAIANVARTIGSFYKPWHESPYSLAVVRSAVATLLTALGPKGEPVFEPEPEDWASILFDTNDPPETVGRALAMMTLTGYMEGKPNG